MNADEAERRPSGGTGAAPALEPDRTGLASEPRASKDGWRARAWWGVVALWKLWFGAVLSTFLALFSFLVVGWATRAAQREVLKTWWRRSPVRARGNTFAGFAQDHAVTAEHAHWPNWFWGEHRDPSGQPGFARWTAGPGRAFGGLARNARIGLQIAFNTAVLTLPGGLLWAGAWFAGWQNSFNKGYEHAAWGPGLFILGMFLFSAAMGYVPLAQARQASTGDWRSFYDFRLVCRLIRRRWLASVALAVVWAAVSGSVLLLKMMPVLAQYMPNLNELSPVEALRFSESFFVVAALFLFPAFVALRLLAARVYADALRSSFQAGAVTEDELGEAEWHALRRLELLTPQPAPERHRFVRLAAWLATRAGQITAVVTVLAVWFGFSFLVVVSEFICKTENGRGWWNQPMIQLPWFDYTPNRLRAAANETTGEPSPRMTKRPLTPPAEVAR